MKKKIILHSIDKGILLFFSYNIKQVAKKKDHFDTVIRHM